MAKQKGIIKIEGTLGDITFVRTKDGYIAKEKTSLSGSKIKSDPSFQRTRENNAEFGRACEASKVLRDAFRHQLQLAKDDKVVSRSVKEMMKVVHADPVNARGLRNVVNGDIELLHGFQFNLNAALSSSFFASYTTNLDRPSGTAEVRISAFTPAADMVAPEGATHYKMVTAASEIDFLAGIADTLTSDSGVLPIDNNQVAPQVLTNALPAGSTKSLFMVFGIQFYQIVNGINYPLKNGIFNPLGIVNVRGM